MVGFLLTVPQTRQVPIHRRITFVVWSGYDDNRPAELYGGNIHGPIFRRFLQDTRVKMVFRSLLQKWRSTARRGQQRELVSEVGKDCGLNWLVVLRAK